MVGVAKPWGVNRKVERGLTVLFRQWNTEVNLLLYQGLVLYRGFSRKGTRVERDVVLNSVSREFRDDDNIFDKIYQTKIYSIFYYKYFFFLNNIQKYIFTIRKNSNLKFKIDRLRLLLSSSYYVFSDITLKKKFFIINSENICCIFGLHFGLHLWMA